MNIHTPSQQSLNEALQLSEQIIQNIELSEIPLSNIALKAARLARILGDFEMEKVFRFEVSGYPLTGENTVAPEAWASGGIAGRHVETRDKDALVNKMQIQSISQLEMIIKIGEIALAAAKDADVSVTSANPGQFVSAPAKNTTERNAIRADIYSSTQLLSSRTSLIYTYALDKYYELKYSGIADDIFSRKRTQIDDSLFRTVPGAVKKFTSVYENLSSDNPEDWSNAVHSCRKILQDLADALFPETEDMTVLLDGREKIIKLGKDNYVNRLIAYLEKNSDSETAKNIIGSHLSFIGDRLDSILNAAQKGSHSTILTKEEADRYVIYTYLITGDILSLGQKQVEVKQL